MAQWRTAGGAGGGEPEFVAPPGMAGFAGELEEPWAAVEALPEPEAFPAW